MNRRDLTRYKDITKVVNKRQTDKGFSFLEGLDLIDFRDDLSYK